MIVVIKRASTMLKDSVRCAIVTLAERRRPAIVDTKTDHVMREICVITVISSGITNTLDQNLEIHSQIVLRNF